MATKVTIGLTNYTGAACGFGFTNSECVVEDNVFGLEIRLRRLKALYHNSKWEKVEARVPKPAALSVIEDLPPSGLAEPPVTAVRRLGGRKKKD